MKTAARTTRPALFAKTYWGVFTHNDKDFPESIYAAREQFLREFDPARHYSTRADYVLNDYLRELDHLETYLCRDGRVVLVCSNYGSTRPPAWLRMVPYWPMYYPGATTYIRAFKSRLEYADTMRLAKSFAMLDAAARETLLALLNAGRA